MIAAIYNMILDTGFWMLVVASIQSRGGTSLRLPGPYRPGTGK
jgi:hypothetical protein